LHARPARHLAGGSGPGVRRARIILLNQLGVTSLDHTIKPISQVWARDKHDINPVNQKELSQPWPGPDVQGLCYISIDF